MTLTLSAVIKTKISMAKDTKINQNSEHQISTIDSASDSTQFLIQKLEVKTRTEVFNKTNTPSSNKFLKELSLTNHNKTIKEYGLNMVK